MDIHFRQAPGPGGSSYHCLYCSLACAEREEDPRIREQPAFRVGPRLLAPDHSGHRCRVCKRRLEGPEPPKPTISKIPVRD